MLLPLLHSFIRTHTHTHTVRSLSDEVIQRTLPGEWSGSSLASSSPPSSPSESMNGHRRWILRALYVLPWLLVNTLLILLITCWKRFANDYLHIGATITWLIFTVQGKSLFFLLSFFACSWMHVRGVDVVSRHIFASPSGWPSGLLFCFVCTP